MAGAEKPEAGRAGEDPSDAHGFPAQNRQQAAFLVEASRLLAESLDYETTLETVTGLSLPHLGAWCIVDILEEAAQEEQAAVRGEHHEGVPRQEEPDSTEGAAGTDDGFDRGPEELGGRMRRLSIVHPEPSKQRLVNQLMESWPPKRADPFGLPRAAASRKSEIIPEVNDELLQQVARSEKNLEVLRDLGIGSLMVIPLAARERVLGAITYVAPTDHAYEEHDLELAEDLGNRCALAVDNARLYKQAKEAKERAERAEEANEAKNLFLGTMSHELRTPLNAIAGYTDLLTMDIDGSLTDYQRNQVHRIQVNERHLLALVDSVLNFARIESGQVEFACTDVEPHEVFDHVEAVLRPIADEHGIPYPDPCDGRLVHVRVRDTGAGVAEEHQDRIFEPFVQVEEGLPRERSGTGLGLAIARKLARGMGGDITLRSTLGEGSEFTPSLPRGDSTVGEPGRSH